MRRRDAADEKYNRKKEEDERSVQETTSGRRRAPFFSQRGIFAPTLLLAFGIFASMGLHRAKHVLSGAATFAEKVGDSLLVRLTWSEEKGPIRVYDLKVLRRQGAPLSCAWARVNDGKSLVSTQLEETETSVTPLVGIFTVFADTADESLSLEVLHCSDGCRKIDPLRLWRQNLPLDPIGGKETASLPNKLRMRESRGARWVKSEQLLFNNSLLDAEHPFIWSTVTAATAISETDLLTLDDGITVMKPATPIPPEMDDLSNFELVCFVGSLSSAFPLRRAFLSIRKYLFPNQRPFKFHYFEVVDLENPTRAWPEGDTFYKCKNLFISIDELVVDLPAKTWIVHLKQFLQDAMKAIPDETFKFWVLTTQRHPLDHAGTGADRKCSPYHPYNDELFRLFRDSPFPSRVRLVDNTDLVSPLFWEFKEDILAVTAMRVFAILGRQVKEWRTAGQRGVRAGLKRNNTIEPNPSHTAYAPWVEAARQGK